MVDHFHDSSDSKHESFLEKLVDKIHHAQTPPLLHYRTPKMRNRYSNPHISQCLSRILTVLRTSTVMVSGDRVRIGEEFMEGVLGLANGLVQLGLRPGDVVAVSANNGDSYLEWLLAVAHVGGILAPLNYRWSFEENRFAFEAFRPVLLVVDESYRWDLESIYRTVNSLKWLVFMVSAPSMSSSGHSGLTTEMLKSSTPNSSSLGYSWAPDKAVLVCFTSGTTGKPKRVIISHAALIVQSLAKLAVVGYTEDDVYLHTALLCHIGGISSAMAILMVGGCHVLMPKFESTAVIEAIEWNHVTSFITVPTMMADLISALKLKKTWEGTESVKKILNGQPSLLQKTSPRMLQLNFKAPTLWMLRTITWSSTSKELTICSHLLQTLLNSGNLMLLHLKLPFNVK